MHVTRNGTGCGTETVRDRTAISRRTSKRYPVATRRRENNEMYRIRMTAHRGVFQPFPTTVSGASESLQVFGIFSLEPRRLAGAPKVPDKSGRDINSLFDGDEKLRGARRGWLLSRRIIRGRFDGAHCLNGPWDREFRGASAGEMFAGLLEKGGCILGLRGG